MGTFDGLDERSPVLSAVNGHRSTHPAGTGNPVATRRNNSASVGFVYARASSAGAALDEAAGRRAAAARERE